MTLSVNKVENPGENQKLPSRDESASKLLSEVCIRLRETWEKEHHDLVPPSSPKDDLKFDVYEGLPTELPDVRALEVPYVREVGVKAVIERLGEHFQCTNYHINLLHFWFLDIMADCLWRTQDEFRLTEADQKIVLQWIIFTFNLIRDPKLNYDRKTLFRVVKEALLLACDAISEHSSEIPTPEALFVILEPDANEDETREDPSLPSFQTTVSTLSCDKRAGSFLQFNIDDNTRTYKLGKQVCVCHISSDTCCDSLTDSSFKSAESAFSALLDSDLDEPEAGVEEDAEGFEDESGEEIEFYKPNSELPMRFRPVEDYANYTEKTYRPCFLDMDNSVCGEAQEEEETHNQNLVQDETNSTQETNSTSLFYEINVEDYNELLKPDPPEEFHLQQPDPQEVAPEKLLPKSKSTLTAKSTESLKGSKKSGAKPKPSSETPVVASTPVATKLSAQKAEQIDKQRLLNRLTQLKLWEFKMQQMGDSKEGLIPTPEESQPEITEVIFEDNELDPEWLEIGDQYEDEHAKNQDVKFINFHVLHAIIDFIFDYFYENFHFTLIKLAYQQPLWLAIQDANETWKVPKVPKQELVKPKEPKAKKKKKEKKAKKDKKKKKDKKSSKSSKKSKKSKDSKKSKAKSKKSPKKKLTKEEKAELERQRKEQERLEEERRKMEENRRNLFPLDDAATDELFNKIFDHWTRVDYAKKGKKKGKDKKSKKGK